MVEWSRALDVRLSERCCSVSMVWVQIRRGKNKNLTALKSNSNTVWFNFQTCIYINIKEISEKRTKRNFHNILVLTFSLLLQIFRYNVYKCVYIYMCDDFVCLNINLHGLR